jgi:hypothetical protein
MASSESGPMVDIKTESAGSLTSARFSALRRAMLAALLMSVFAGALSWYFAAKYVSSYWLATALVKIGQVGVFPEMIVVPIEPAARALERARSPAFTATLLNQLGLPTEDPTENADAMMVRRSLRLSSPRNSELLEFQVEGSSPEEARKRLVLAVDILSTAHSGISAPLIKSLRASLAQTESKLAEVVNERDRLSRLVGPQQGPAGARGFSESVLLSNLLSKRDEQILDLTKQQLQIVSLLGSSRTFPTGILSEDAVSLRMVKPDKIIKVTLAAALIGLAIGLIPVFRLRGGWSAAAR